MFQKESARLVTYRNVTRPNFSAPYTTDHYAQLDFVLINQRWKNSITNVETTLQHSITTDHKLLVANLSTKLAHKHMHSPERRPKYRPPNDELLKNYNLLVSTAFEHQQVLTAEDPFETWASIFQDAAAKAFTEVPAKQRKPYISEETWQLLCNKQDKISHGLTHEADEIEKILRKHLRQDKTKFMIEQLETMDEQGYKWQGIKSLRKKFVRKHCKFKDSLGNYIPESSFPEKAAEYLAEVQWKPPDGNYVPRTQPLSYIGENLKDTEWE